MKVKAERGHLGTAIKAEVRAKAEARLKGEGRRPSLSQLLLKTDVKRESRREEKHEVKAKTERGAKEPTDWTAELLRRGQLLRNMAAKDNIRVKLEMLKQKNGKKATKLEKGKVCVKSEKGGKAKAKKSKRKKGKPTAARRNASREVMSREIPLSPDLANLLSATSLSRPEAVKRLWAYCKDQGMQNPADGREVIFDEKLSEMFGVERARMTDFIGLLVPHLLYAGSSSLGSETSDPPPTTPQKLERPSVLSPTILKVQQTPRVEGTPVAVKRARPEEEAPEIGSSSSEGCGSFVKRLKAETEFAVTKQVSIEVPPRLLRFDRTSVVVDFTPPPGLGGVELEVVATPQRGPSQPDAIRLISAPCKVEFLEGVDGNMEPRGQADVADLDPAQAYDIVVSIRGQPPSPHAPRATLPQRAEPAKWTAQEALCWSASLQVPELSQKVREYAIDGATLMTLGEEDLRALGLVAPFLLRRVLSGIVALRSGV